MLDLSRKDIPENLLKKRRFSKINGIESVNEGQNSLISKSLTIIINS